VAIEQWTRAPVEQPNVEPFSDKELNKVLGYGIDAVAERRHSSSGRQENRAAVSPCGMVQTQRGTVECREIDSFKGWADERSPDAEKRTKAADGTSAPHR
jgi:hypothetical protein